MNVQVQLEGTQMNIAIFDLNLIFVAVKVYIMIGINETKSIYINFKGILIFKDDLVSNLSLKC